MSLREAKERGALLRTDHCCQNGGVFPLRLALGFSVVLGFAVLAGKAAAAPTGAVPASAGQAALSVGLDAAGTLKAAACQQLPCDVGAGTTLDLPKELARRVEIATYPIGGGRHVVHVRAPDAAASRAWEALIVAPLGSKQPKIVFRGYTGLIQGEYGLRNGPMVVIGDAEPDGARRIVVGEQREEATLCGRPTVLMPQVLTPNDLELHPAKVQRLTSSERGRAQRITARRMPESPPSSARLLRAVAASSAVGSPQALTDGDIETTWAENRGGDGRGEFVVLQAPPELPIRGFEVVVRPAKAKPEHGVAPSEFWLATSKSLWLVVLPEDAWEHPGARYEIPLPEAVVTDCVALVTESGFRTDRDAQVTFAELVARSELDTGNPATLALALDHGGPRADAAAAALRSHGEVGFVAVAESFSRLDEAGRRVALGVLDAAPCKVSSPVYVSALAGKSPAERHHARARLERCGEEAAAALEGALPQAGPKARMLLGDELALVAPARAWRALLGPLASPRADERRAFRVALARAAAALSARPAVMAALEDASLPEAVLIDLLRALGQRLPEFAPAAERAFVRLAQPAASFRTRFLLAEPAAWLASSSARARDFLVRALTRDDRAEIRAQAARSVADPTKFQSELRATLTDPAVRVREASLTSLGGPHGAFAWLEIMGRLSDDPWPLVRRAAAEALATQPPNPRVDQALIKALEDFSPDVRTGAASALGERRTPAALPGLRERLTDRKEVIGVRVAAAGALGRICALAAADDLTRYALLLVDATAGEDRLIAPTALTALAKLHPPDLPRRLAPLLAPKAPTGIRETAKAALERPGHCSSR